MAVMFDNSTEIETEREKLAELATDLESAKTELQSLCDKANGLRTLPSGNMSGQAVALSMKIAEQQDRIADIENAMQIQRSIIERLRAERNVELLAEHLPQDEMEVAAIFDALTAAVDALEARQNSHLELGKQGVRIEHPLKKLPLIFGGALTQQLRNVLRENRKLYPELIEKRFEVRR